MPNTDATALWPIDALQTAVTNWPTDVAARMMGSEAPTAVAGTMPASTRPSAIDPTMKLGSPTTVGSPASGPATVGAASSGWAGGSAEPSAVASSVVIAAPLVVGPAAWESCCGGRRRTWVPRRPAAPDVRDRMARREPRHHASGRHLPVRSDRFTDTRDRLGPRPGPPRRPR